MDRDLTGLGAFILLGSIFLYAVFAPTVNSYDREYGRETMNILEDDPEMREFFSEYYGARTIVTWSFYGFFIGVGLAIVGLLGKEKTKSIFGGAGVSQGQPQQRHNPDGRYYCQNCGGQLRYIGQYKRWYCDQCKQYL